MSAAHERRSHRAEAVVSLALALGAAVLSGLIAAHPGARPAEGEARVLLVAPSSMAPVAAHERTTRPGAPRWQVVSAPRPARPGSTQADLAIVDGGALDLDEVEVEAGSSPERRARLRRDAIDFEIVRRAAVEEGVALAPEERRALERLWGEATTRDARVADRVGLDPAAAERDLRAFETRMLLEAIASAHEIGIVHRDLKPSNIFLALRPDRSRRVKLLDFGISKTLADTNITQTNGIVGTPAYMSPEQAKNSRKTDLRTDIWSVGAILYELLCGQTPYTGETSGEVLAALLGEEPRPLHELAPHLPAPLCAIVHRCLSRDRERRFQSAGELSRALSPYAATASNTALPHSAAHITVDSSASLVPSSGASSRALSQPDALTLAAPGEGEGMTVSGWSQVRRGAEKDRLRRGLWAAAAVVVTALLAITLVLVRATQRAVATAPPAAAAPVTKPPASPAPSIAVEAVPTAMPAEPTSAGAAIPAEKPPAPVPSSAKTAPLPKPYSPSGAKKPTSKNPLLDTRD